MVDVNVTVPVAKFQIPYWLLPLPPPPATILDVAVTVPVVLLYIANETPPFIVEPEIVIVAVELLRTAPAAPLDIVEFEIVIGPAADENKG